MPLSNVVRIDQKVKNWGGLGKAAADRHSCRQTAAQLHKLTALQTLSAVLKGIFSSIRSPQIILTATAPLMEREFSSSDQLRRLGAFKDVSIPIKKKNKEHQLAETLIFLHINNFCENASSSLFLEQINHEVACQCSCPSVAYISFKSARKKSTYFSFLCASLNFSVYLEKRPIWIPLARTATSWWMFLSLASSKASSGKSIAWHNSKQKLVWVHCVKCFSSLRSGGTYKLCWYQHVHRWVQTFISTL